MLTISSDNPPKVAHSVLLNVVYCDYGDLLQLTSARRGIGRRMITMTATKTPSLTELGLVSNERRIHLISRGILLINYCPNTVQSKRSGRKG